MRIDIEGRKIPHEKRLKHVLRNREALKLLLDKLPDEIESVCDFFAGAGFWAEELVERFPFVTLRDYDEACARHLEDTFPDAACIWGDSFESLGEPYDLKLCDFTKMTMLWKRDLAELGLFDHGWTIFSDCAGAKLHLNFRSYGLERPVYEDYLREYRKRLKKRGVNVVAAVCCGVNRFDSGYLMTGPERRRMTIDYVA